MSEKTARDVIAEAHHKEWWPEKRFEGQVGNVSYKTADAILSALHAAGFDEPSRWMPIETLPTTGEPFQFLAIDMREGVGERFAYGEMELFNGPINTDGRAMCQNSANVSDVKKHFTHWRYPAMPPPGAKG